MYPSICFFKILLYSCEHYSLHASVVGFELIIQHRDLSLRWENIPDTIQQNVFHGGF